MIELIFDITNVKNKSKLWWTIYRFSWLDKKNKKVTINPINDDDDKFFQYTTTVALNHKLIRQKL